MGPGGTQSESYHLLDGGPYREGWEVKPEGGPAFIKCLLHALCQALRIMNLFNLPNNLRESCSPTWSMRRPCLREVSCPQSGAGIQTQVRGSVGSMLHRTWGKAE